MKMKKETKVAAAELIAELLNSQHHDYVREFFWSDSGRLVDLVANAKGLATAVVDEYYRFADQDDLDIPKDAVIEVLNTYSNKQILRMAVDGLEE